MTFEINFTPEAEETYDAVVSQLRERWGARFVDKFEAKILKIINTISATPFVYPIDNYNAGLRKCVPHKNCSMYYKVNPTEIVIVYFWDNRQDPLIIL